MKKIITIFGLTGLLFSFVGCQKEGIDDDTSFLSTAASGNLSKIFDISNDNSGNVKITPTGEGVSSFTVAYGHGTGPAASAVVSPGGSTTHSYPEGTYTVAITAKDIAGQETVKTYPLQVTYRAPENLQVTTSGEMKVKATALYANSFLVYYGDVPNEVGTPMAVGQELPAHTYPAGGPYDLKVIAQSGGAATTQLIKTLFGLPLSFESATMDYFFGTFGNVVFTKVANPSSNGLNTSATVGKYEKPVGAASWSGTYSPLNIPINFAHGKKMKMMVYNPSAGNIGKKINVELEWAIGTASANPWGAVVKTALTTSGAWEELEFDFSGNAAIPGTAKFTQLVLRFNDAADGSGEIIYIDNIRITN
jgi:hypothetical protein